MRAFRTDGQVVVESEVLSTPSPSSRGPGRGPFKAKTRVRIPLGTPHLPTISREKSAVSVPSPVNRHRSGANVTRPLSSDEMIGRACVGSSARTVRQDVASSRSSSLYVRCPARRKGGRVANDARAASRDYRVIRPAVSPIAKIKRPPSPVQACPRCRRVLGVEESDTTGSSLRWFDCRALRWVISNDVGGVKPHHLPIRLRL